MLIIASYQKCNEVIQQDKQYIAPCQHATPCPLVVDKAKGAVVWDLDGNKFIDFLSGASYLNIGSSHPAVNRAVLRQLRTTAQYTTAYSYNKPSADYAKALAQIYPGDIAVKVCFGNSGSDANDAAIKFARAFTGRKNILVFKNAYHGASYGSASLTSWKKGVFEQIEPLLPGIYRMNYYESGYYTTTQEELEGEFAGIVEPQSVAAVIIEPMQGDGGMIPADSAFMKHLYSLCKKHDILFFSEEVQQGFYRTGKCFAIEHYHIVPDGIIIAKSAGGGLVLGAFIGRAEMMDSLPALAHLFTASANHLSCTAGHAALNYMQSAGFQNRLKRNIIITKDAVNALQKRHPNTIGFVRLLGMSAGIGITPANHQSAHERAVKIVLLCHSNGLIIISSSKGVLRLQPPLNISERNLKKGFQLLDKAVTELEEGK